MGEFGKVESMRRLSALAITMAVGAPLAGCGLDAADNQQPEEAATETPIRAEVKSLSYIERLAAIKAKQDQNPWLGTRTKLSNALSPPGGMAQYHDDVTNPQDGAIYVGDSVAAWQGLYEAAHVVYGGIVLRYRALGAQKSVLGYPVTDERDLYPASLGRYSAFENGCIYWSPGTGAWEVPGTTMNRYAALGYERSNLGLPVSGEMSGHGGKWTKFENGGMFTRGSGAPMRTTYPVMFKSLQVARYNIGNANITASLSGWNYIIVNGTNWPAGHQIEILWADPDNYQTSGGWAMAGADGTFTFHAYYDVTTCTSVDSTITILAEDVTDNTSEAVAGVYYNACPTNLSSSTL